MSNGLRDERRREVSVQSVDRALRMLRSFHATDQGIGVSDFAKLLGVHKTTASRLTATLARHGLIERPSSGQPYRLGPEARRLGTLALESHDLMAQARAGMERLSAQTGETVTLGVTDGSDRLRVISQVNSRFVVGVTDWVGQTTPLHATSDGKIALAFGEATLDGGPLEPLTDRTITDVDELHRQIDRSRLDGWASAIGELEIGLNGVAAPILDGSGNLRAVLSVSGPTYRCPEERLPQLADTCKEIAAGISARLWGLPAPSTASSSGQRRRVGHDGTP